MSKDKQTFKEEASDDEQKMPELRVNKKALKKIKSEGPFKGKNVMLLDRDGKIMA